MNEWRKLDRDTWRLDYSREYTIIVYRNGRHWLFSRTYDMGCFGSGRYGTLKDAKKLALESVLGELKFLAEHKPGRFFVPNS
jgi:hypothetical protein